MRKIGWPERTNLFCFYSGLRRLLASICCTLFRCGVLRWNGLQYGLHIAVGEQQ